MEARGRLSGAAPGAAETGQRLIGVVTDVSDRKASEKLLESTVTRLAAVVDHIADGIVTLDAAGCVRSVNRAAERILGMTRRSLVGTVLGERLSGLPEDPLDPGPLSWGSLADGRVREGQLTRGDGAAAFLRVSPVSCGITNIVEDVDCGGKGAEAGEA